jgi:2-oxo-4-hydroxy-4-carboxy-5-ureidoimidazoline decarboxylase
MCDASHGTDERAAMQVEEFNALSVDAARAGVDGCLGVRRWVDEVIEARPYVDLAAMLRHAKASAENLTDDELAAALTRHPRIGEQLDTGAVASVEPEFSHAEQAGLDPADAAVAERLRLGNQRYEQRFNRVFLIRAAGRSSEEILSELERRLGNDDETERRELVAALRDIAILRLQQVVCP